MTDVLAAMPKYEAYEDSGIDWLGDIPKGWVLRRFKHYFSSAMGETILANDLVDGGSIPVYSATEGEQFFGYVDNSGVALNEGDIVIPARGNSIGFPKLVKEKATCSQTTIYAKKCQSISSRYVYYYLLGCKPYIFQFVQTAIPQITVDEVKNNPLVQPPETLQTTIANFLDRKTAQIDQAIAIKEKQITLLKERKQILIQNAVTRGLDPNVPMKESGVEWIGEVPRHWKTKRLKYVVKILKRIIGFEGPDVLSITLQGIKVKDIKSGEGQLAMDYSKYQNLKPGEFAMNHMDLLTGYVDISMYDGVVSPDYRVFANTSNEMTDRYLLAIFQLGYKQRIFYRYGQGVSLLGRWRFPADNFKNFFVPIPPKDEQEYIISYIEKESNNIENAIHLLERQIEKQKEYKTILINSAVTGKINVA